jgi:glutamate-1-semialdehyde 2,1-aminomutase
MQDTSAPTPEGNEALHKRAVEVLPAGGFGNYDPNFTITRGLAGHVWDADGREYVDFLIGSGPMIVGHAHPEVNEVIFEQVANGTTFFANNPHGIALAEAICDAVACAEQVRYVCTGTEADMYAVRLARAFTGRDKLLKFEGGYHGMSEIGQMSLAPTQLANFPQPVPDSAGIPANERDNVLVAPFNDPDFAISLLDEYDGQIAAIIVEPLQRLIPPAPGFLETLRAETEKRGIVLIFDEVVTGFRLAYGGAQEAYGVVPDLCTMGKAIGGGFGLAAIAGRKDIMAHFDKAAVGEGQSLMQVGTLSGNPVAAAAGLKTLEILRRPGSYERIYQTGTAIMTAIREACGEHGIPVQVVGEPVMFDAVFTDRPIVNYRDMLRGDAARSATFNRVLREHGIFKSPSKFYVSLAHTDDDVAQTVSAVEAAAKAVATKN